VRINFAVLFMTAATVIGCGADEGRGSEQGGVITASGTTAATGPAGTDSGDEGKLDLGSEETTTASPPGGDCAAISETASVGLQPADIIFIVDNSGSMDFEASSVQANLNAFSSQIFLANIDAHVVLLSAYPSSGQGICIAPPLGAGGCPASDDNAPSFTHVDVGIGSNDGLQQLIQHFPDFAPVLRPTASRHVVIVSDDNSDLSVADFQSMWAGLDPNNAGYQFHGIVADEGPVAACLNSNPCCAISAAVGSVYLDLINVTGGIFGNLCLQEFQPIFDELAQQVIAGATLACEYEIPPTPEGEDFDKDEVNVEFEDGNGGLLSIGRVDGYADCANVSNGWYYDDPNAPSRIIVCPQTCDTIQGFDSASVSIQFGCATIPAG
jgi:hypothetical protein